MAIFDEVLGPLERQLSSNDPASPYADEAEREHARVLAMAIMENSPTAPTSHPDHGDGQPANLSLLGEYKLLEPIGRCGMGMVFRALHTQMNRIVAIKCLPRSSCEDEQAIERFRREIDMVAQLDHPNIVRAYDARETEGERFLVTEFVPGLDVARLIHICGLLSPADACEIVRQAAVALQFVHQHHLVHRDVKPSNIIVSPAGDVKLLDLGLALVPGHAAELTDPGQLMGTLDYMAPEQASDSHDVDIRADVYGLGATLYKLLCGHSPLPTKDDASPAQKLVALTRKRCVPIQYRAPEIPDALAKVLHRSLRKRPTRRYRTQAEFADALNPFCADSDLPKLLVRAERLDPQGQSSDNSLVSTSRMGVDRAVTTPRRKSGFCEKSRATRRLAKQLVWFVLVMAGVLLLAGIVIRVHHGRQLTLIRAPDNADVQVGVDAAGAISVDVNLPPEIPAATRPMSSTTPRGWYRRRYDFGNTSCYPYPTTTRTSHELVVHDWTTDHFLGRVWSVVTGDLTADGYAEIVVRDADTVVAFNRWGKELWRRDPIVDSKVPIPPGRTAHASNIELADIDQDGNPEVIVLAGSEISSGWSHKAPQMAVVYDGDGKMLKAFPILEGTTGILSGCLDYNGDGQIDLVATMAAYRHPHAVCIYDLASTQLAFQADFADYPEVAGIGDIDADGRLDLYLLQSFNGETSALSLLRFARPKSSDVTADLKQPGQVVNRFTAALQKNQIERALEYVVKAQRSDIKLKLTTVDWSSLSIDTKYKQSVHVNDATIIAPAFSNVVFKLSYTNDRWWIADLEIQDHDQQ